MKILSFVLFLSLMTMSLAARTLLEIQPNYTRNVTVKADLHSLIIKNMNTKLLDDRCHRLVEVDLHFIINDDKVCPKPDKSPTITKNDIIELDCHQDISSKAVGPWVVGQSYNFSYEENTLARLCTSTSIAGCFLFFSIIMVMLYGPDPRVWLPNLMRIA